VFTPWHLITLGLAVRQGSLEAIPFTWPWPAGRATKQFACRLAIIKRNELCARKSLFCSAGRSHPRIVAAATEAEVKDARLPLGIVSLRSNGSV